MKRSAIIIGVLVVLVIGGITAWLLLGSQPQNNNANNSDPTSTVDKSGDSDTVTVTMKNSAFTPQNIKVKVGTTVRWVNEDDVRHNVVALDENDQSALPTQNPLFGKGGKYEYTFTTVGTFKYKCTPHPFMTGSVEVVE